MNNLKFKGLKNNVERWGAAREIYVHSTPLAQSLKTLSEVGALADAAIKSDAMGVQYGIGDIAICLINYAAMRRMDLSEIIYWLEAGYKNVAPLQDEVARLAASISNIEACSFPEMQRENEIENSFTQLQRVSIAAGFDFLDCCELAWQKIKNRKGAIVAAGAYVREGG